jgi:hypothetical protein
MKELIISFVQEVSAHFDGKTVGNGGDFGSTLTVGPFDVTAYFHQWQEISNPSIHVQIIQESPASANFECCGGPTNLLLNVRISVDQKGQGWSVAMALYEELRDWLCEENYSYAPDGEDYLVILDQSSITANHVYEGDVFSIHTTIALTYLRRFES